MRRRYRRLTINLPHISNRSHYGNSTVRFLAASITSILGRWGAGAGVTSNAVSTTTGRLGRGRRTMFDVAVSLFALMPGSGTGIAPSPARRERLFAPGVVSSPWSTELRITSCKLPSLVASASFSACSGVTWRVTALTRCASLSFFGLSIFWPLARTLMFWRTIFEIFSSFPPVLADP